MKLKIVVYNLRLRLKKKNRNDWLLARKQPIIALYFESETVLRFYNLEAWLK